MVEKIGEIAKVGKQKYDSSVADLEGHLVILLYVDVELHIVQTATAHRASTHNTQRQEEYMVLAMLA